MDNDLKLTVQEKKVVNFLVQHNHNTVYWEELAQFAKSPQTVKLKSTQRTISEIRRKFVQAGIPVPFDVMFSSLSSVELKEESKPVNQVIKEKLADNLGQTLVQVKRTPDGNVVKMDSNSTTTKHAVHIDYVLEPATRSVRTKYGMHKLNEREWDVMKYLHQNVGKVVTVTEIKDKVMYQNWGSKTPARWFDHVKSVIGNIRAQVPGLKVRILTVKGVETGYIFQ